MSLSSGDGQIRAQGLDGVYTNDFRVLSRLEVEVADAVVEPVGWQLQSPARAVFTSRVRLADDQGADPSVVLQRRRSVARDGLTERLELINYGDGAVTATLRARAATDLAPVHVVRGGGRAPQVAPRLVAGGANWVGTGQEVVLTADPVPAHVTSEDAGLALSFTLELGAEQSAGVNLRVVTQNNDRGAAARTFLSAHPQTPPVLAPQGALPQDSSRRRLLQASMRDLQRMLLADQRAPDAGVRQLLPPPGEHPRPLRPGGQVPRPQGRQHHQRHAGGALRLQQLAAIPDLATRPMAP